jgi:aminopeptidase
VSRDSPASQDLLERYAQLVMRVGINVEPGREVAIRGLIDHAPLVRALVRAGYEAGARRVEVDYQDLEVLRSQIKLAPDEAVGTAPRWMFERLDDVREQRRAQVSVIGFPPDMFGGLDPARVARSFPARGAPRGTPQAAGGESTPLDAHQLRDGLLGRAGVRQA